jgi:hypothetical protein
MVAGEVLMNYSVESPGLYFKAADGSLIVAGPVPVTPTAPNSVPAPGGFPGNSIGEMWFNNTDPSNVSLNVFTGSNWVPAYGNPLGGWSDLTNLIVGTNKPASWTTATNNVFVGAGNTIKLTTGSNNSVFGTGNAGSGLTTNSFCTVVGEASVSRLAGATGDNATSIGARSMANATVIKDCTAVGFEALLSCGGEGNTGVGYQAAKLTTAGTFNIAIGYGALPNNTTGSNNIAIGNNALSFSTTESNNIGVGANAGSTLKAGSQNNIIFGSGAGPRDFGTTPVSNSIFFGVGAGRQLNAGNNNIFFGNDCMGGGTNNPRTANNSVFIGQFLASKTQDVAYDGELLIGADSVALRFNKFGAMSMGANGFGQPGAPLIQEGQDGSYFASGPTRWFNDGPQAEFISSDNKRITVKYGLIQSITQL